MAIPRRAVESAPADRLRDGPTATTFGSRRPNAASALR
jgi:hypothetical protein